MRRVLSLLKLSGLVIDLNESRDYFSFLIILNVFTLIISYFLQLQFIYILLIAIVLIIQLIRVERHKLPHPDLEKIIYNGSEWCLQYRDGKQISYSHVKIRLDAGFLFIVAFCNKFKFTNLVIFNDQLAADTRRIIYVLEKVANKA